LLAFGQENIQLDRLAQMNQESEQAQERLAWIRGLGDGLAALFTGLAGLAVLCLAIHWSVMAKSMAFTWHCSLWLPSPASKQFNRSLLPWDKPRPARKRSAAVRINRYCTAGARSLLSCSHASGIQSGCQRVKLPLRPRADVHSPVIKFSIAGWRRLAIVGQAELENRP